MYLKCVPRQTLVFPTVFDDPALTGEMRVTVTLNHMSDGTELAIVQARIPDSNPVEA